MYKPILALLIILHSCPGIAQETAGTCDFIDGLSAISEVECGKISVPEDHEDPEGKKISVAYVIVKGKNKTDKEPVIILGGGPGAEMISAGIVEYLLQDPLRENRDIIIYEQRGIGHSSGLPDINSELEKIMAADLTVKEEKEEMKKLILKAREMAGEKDIDLSNYNTWQNANDVGSLMEDLKYPKYNLYGISYGTRLARKVQDLYPGYLNAVIHNSPALSSGDLLIDRLHNYSNALEKILNYCENDSGCNKQYPHLQQTYLKAIDNIKNQPLELEVRGEPYYVNAQDAIYFLRKELYSSGALKNVPALIVELKERGGPILEKLVAHNFEMNYNNLMWLAVERNEMFNPENTEEKIGKVYKRLQLLPEELGLFTAVYIAFKDLHAGSLSEEKSAFQFSDVPTMILVNQYDPVTPPKNGYIFKEKIPNALLYVLDEGGHGGGNEDCRTRVMIDFMNDPSKIPDFSCMKLVRSKKK